MPSLESLFIWGILYLLVGADLQINREIFDRAYLMQWKYYEYAEFYDSWNVHAVGYRLGSLALFFLARILGTSGRIMMISIIVFFSRPIIGITASVALAVILILVILMSIVTKMQQHLQ